VRALLRSGALAPNDVWAANRSTAKLDALAMDFPDIHLASIRELAAVKLCMPRPTRIGLAPGDRVRFAGKSRQNL
jgi:hypothetical protein